MRTAEKIAYSIKHILKKLNVKTDDLKDEYLYHRIPTYAAQVMAVEYSKKLSVDPLWIFNLGKVDTENVNSGDDPNVMNGSVVLSRYRMPGAISFGKKPFLKAYTGLRTFSYTFIDNFDMFFMIYKGDRGMLEKYPVSLYIGGNVYIYPNKGLQIQFVPSNPFECNIRRELRHPNTGELIHNAETLRPFTVLDPYPISPSVEYGLILDLIANEFQINRQLIVDKIQDGNDETRKG
jgi:hypothetical protein